MTGLATETHLMSAREVMDLCHIGKTTLWEWRTSGRLTGVQHVAPNGKWYYPANQPIIENALRAVGSIR